MKFLSSKMSTKRTKSRLYRYGYSKTNFNEWILCDLDSDEHKEKKGENFRKLSLKKRLRTSIRYRHRKLTQKVQYNKELQELLEKEPIHDFIKGQSIQWLGRIMRRKENYQLNATLELIPQGKRPRGRPRKIWLYEIEEDLKRLSVENGRDLVQVISGAILWRW